MTELQSVWVKIELALQHRFHGNSYCFPEWPAAAAAVAMAAAVAAAGLRELSLLRELMALMSV